MCTCDIHPKVAIKYKNQLIAIINKYLPADAKIYLFGSRARSTHGPGSDIDIAVDTGAPIDWAILGALKEEIADSDVPLFVDIIDLHEVSEDMQQLIKRDGILWNKNS